MGDISTLCWKFDMFFFFFIRDDDNHTCNYLHYKLTLKQVSVKGKSSVIFQNSKIYIYFQIKMNKQFQSL